MESDRVNLGVDDVEAQADAAEAALNNDDDQEGENPEGENPEGENPEGEIPLDLDLDAEESTEEDEKTDEENPVKKEEESEEEDEGAEHLNDSLEKTPLKTKPAIVEDGEAKPVDKTKKKLFLKKSKVQESIHINLKKKLNECNVGDTVIYNKQTGFITGEIGGKLIVQVQGTSYRVNPNEVKATTEKPKSMDVPFKFDKITQKALREQFVKCGIFMNSVPIKINECFVIYNEWDNSRDDQFVNVIIEGRSNMMQKSQVKILENINDFANPDNYVPGAIIDEATGQVIENVLINAVDYTQAIGDTSSVRIIRQSNEGQVSDNLPISQLKTLTV